MSKMRIDSYMAVNQVYGQNTTRRSPYAAASQARDAVEISDFGNAYQVAKKAAAGTEPVREDKVNEIKNQLANGTYNVPLTAVAQSMAERLLG
ncbi:MAG TPA: flagellar biosynthesis anti-sigma factor FlgM [Lachnospiraceae bacterium]|nr:flagellar biosynthesis anti-sigma factor FlgM [Lachnospiraceae bacterium]